MCLNRKRYEFLLFFKITKEELLLSGKLTGSFCKTIFLIFYSLVNQNNNFCNRLASHLKLFCKLTRYNPGVPINSVF